MKFKICPIPLPNTFSLRFRFLRWQMSCLSSIKPVSGLYLLVHVIRFYDLYLIEALLIRINKIGQKTHRILLSLLCKVIIINWTTCIKIVLLRYRISPRIVRRHV